MVLDMSDADLKKGAWRRYLITSVSKTLAVLKSTGRRKGAQPGNKNAVGPHIGYHGTSVERATKYITEGVPARKNGFWYGASEKDVYQYGAYHAGEHGVWDEAKKSWKYPEEFAVVKFHHTDPDMYSNADWGPGYKGSKERAVSSTITPEQIESIKVFGFKTRMNKNGDDVYYDYKHLRNLK